MELSVDVLLDELADLAPTTTDACKGKTVAKVRLFSNNKSNFKDCLVVAAPDAVLPYAAQLEGALVVSPGFVRFDDAQKAGLAVISVRGWAGDVSAILDRLMESFERLSQWDADLLRSIASGEGVKGVARVAAREIISPFALMDTALRPIVIGGTLPDDISGTMWENVVGVDYTPNETFQLPPEELCFFEGRGREPYYADVPQLYGDAHNLILNVFQGGQTVATIGTSDIAAPFTDGQVWLLCRVRDAFELALGTLTSNDGEDPALVYYLNRLLEGDGAAGRSVKDLLGPLCYRESEGLLVYVASGSDGSVLEDARANFCVVRVRAHVPGAVVLRKGGLLVVLVGTRDAEGLEGCVQGLGLRCGKSCSFGDVSYLPCAYLQARSALRVQTDSAGQVGPIDFEEHFFDVLLAQTAIPDSEGTCAYFVVPAISLLADYDARTGSDLVGCLKTYLANGCNLAKTAADLAFHRNTLAYRIGKIESLTNLCLGDIDEYHRMVLWLSCFISLSQSVMRRG